MQTTKIAHGAVEPIEKVIFTIRGEKVILDADLAATEPVGSQFHPAVHAAAGGVVAASGSAQSLGPLFSSSFWFTSLPPLDS